MKEINVLSLFDGMSCGQIALERAGIPVKNYYASEIDKHAIKVTMANYPNTIQLGSVTEVKGFDADLLIGGSPCQGFSFAGKGLNFEDPRSKLFFEYVRILNEIRIINPDVKFLLENVKMKKEYQDIISGYLGVEPVFINSALVSAQMRKRLYWTNIPGIEQPEDKGVLLKDIIESGMVDREKSYCIDANYFKGGSLKNYLEKSRRQLDQLSQSEKRLMDHETFTASDKSQTILSTIHKENAKSMVKRGKKGLLVYQMSDTKECSGSQPSIQNRVYDNISKSPALLAGMSGSVYNIYDEIYVRKLTPTECERLQTVPDNYTNHVSNTQRYRMLGNGWTVDVICHIFKQLHPCH